MKRLAVAALLIATSFFIPVPTVAATPAALTASAADIWPHPADRRDPRSVTVTYSATEGGRYALLVEDGRGAVRALVGLGDLPVGTTGTWTWAALGRTGEPVARGHYDVRLLKDDGTWGDDPAAADAWPAVASVTVQVHNSTDQVVIDDHGDGQRVRVDRFVLTNGPTRLGAGFLLSSRSTQPSSFYAGFDVRGVPGGYYAHATRRSNGTFSTRLVYTRSLPGDAAATPVRCRGAKVRRTGASYELVVPRRCLSKVRPTSQVRAFFGATDAYGGYDQPDGLVDSYWTRWTRATERGA